MLTKRKLIDEAEPIRIGRRIGERIPSGTIYEVDPAAVARLKAHFAELEAARANEPQRKSGDILGNLRQTQRERQEELNARMRKPKIPAELARGWHVAYYQAGFTLQEIAEQTGVGRNLLARRFKELGLPVSRKVEERAWRPEKGKGVLHRRSDPSGPKPGE